MEIWEIADAVKTREDFVKYAEALAKEFRQNGAKRWENSDLESYLSAIPRWTSDMNGAFENKGEEVPKEPSWGLFAKILLAATAYE